MIVRCTIFIALLVMSDVASAQSGFTFQGRIRENGVLTTGTCDLRARLYGSEAGSDQVGPQLVFAGLNTVVIDKGLFTIYLDFDSSSFDGSPRWLELDLACPPGSGFATLSPRQPIDSAPYAVHALSGGEWTNIGGNLSVQNALVGIGTDNPQQRLHIFGTSDAAIRFERPSVGAFWDVGPTVDGENGLVFRLNGTSAQLYLGVSGDVGIGTLGPLAAALHVNGNALVSSDLQVDGDLLVPNGNVGIGTSAPKRRSRSSARCEPPGWAAEAASLSR